jgi:hypothetical protein
VGRRCLRILVCGLQGQSSSPIVVKNGNSMYLGQRTIITCWGKCLRSKLFTSLKVCRSIDCQVPGQVPGWSSTSMCSTAPGKSGSIIMLHEMEKRHSSFKPNPGGKAHIACVEEPSNKPMEAVIHPTHPSSDQKLWCFGSLRLFLPVIVQACRAL